MSQKRVVLDTREHELGQALTRLGCAFEWRQMDVGDVELYVGFEEPALTVERKTFADLASSLSDGRFAEQRHRLSDNRVGIAYVVEGSESFASQPPGVRGAMLSLSLNHGIPVFRTADVDDTAVWIRSALDYVFKFSIEAKKNPREEEYAGAACRASCAKIKKKDNVDPRQCFLQQLSQIPGISYGMAKRIAEKPGFETMRKLVATLEAFATDTERKASLQSVEKIGPKLAERVVAYLFATSSTVPSTVPSKALASASECLFVEE